MSELTLEQLQAIEQDTKAEWHKALKELGKAKERADRLAEMHTNAQRALSARLKLIDPLSALEIEEAEKACPRCKSTDRATRNLLPTGVRNTTKPCRNKWHQEKPRDSALVHTP